jgi:addiction module RelE/StbE family toxin
MIKLAYSPAFQWAYKKLYKNNPARQILFQDKISLFLKDPFHTQLRTHKLKGRLKDFYSFTVEYDVRVIFYFVSDSEVVLEDIGSHDEVC